MQLFDNLLKHFRLLLSWRWGILETRRWGQDMNPPLQASKYQSMEWKHLASPMKSTKSSHQQENWSWDFLGFTRTSLEHFHERDTTTV